MGKIVILPPIMKREQYYYLFSNKDAVAFDVDKFTGDLYATELITKVVDKYFPNCGPKTKMIAILTEFHRLKQSKHFAGMTKAEEKASCFISVLRYTVAPASVRGLLLAGDRLDEELAETAMSTLLKNSLPQDEIQKLQARYFPIEFLEYIPDSEVVVPEKNSRL